MLERQDLGQEVLLLRGGSVVDQDRADHLETDALTLRA